MKEQFTKGPWKYSHEPDARTCSDNQHDHKILATNDDCEFRVASVNVYDSEDIANAHLMERSPDLYWMVDSLAKELKAAIAEINRVRFASIRCDQDTPPDLWDEESISIAGKLLAEARGENK